jgi:hypothetical protein
VTDLVTILRHELAKDTGDGAPRIDPFGSVVEARLEAWLTHKNEVEQGVADVGWIDRPDRQRDSGSRRRALFVR